MRILILLALVGTAFAVPKTVSRIVGGEVTTIESYPYMSNMQYAFLGVMWTQYCGGALLTSTLVLSAGHCYYGDAASSWRVRLGTSYASSGGSTHSVSSILLHPNYNTPVLDFDVAIVRLGDAAEYSTSVQVARIPAAAYIVPDGDAVTVLGWGALSSGGGLAEQLRQVEVNVINQDVCVARYAELKTQTGFSDWPDVSSTMLCTGILDVGGKDACQGDSGGPVAYLSDIVVGVTSWGYGCGDSYYPGVNARVSNFTEWIVANA